MHFPALLQFFRQYLTKELHAIRRDRLGRSATENFEVFLLRAQFNCTEYRW